MTTGQQAAIEKEVLKKQVKEVVHSKLVERVAIKFYEAVLQGTKDDIVDPKDTRSRNEKIVHNLGMFLAALADSVGAKSPIEVATIVLVGALQHSLKRDGL